MVRLYFKIPHLDMVRAENFKVRYRQNTIAVSISWPQHLKQTIDVGPFTDSIDSKSIVVSRKGEQVVVSMAKLIKQKWDSLTRTSGGYKDIRLDHIHRGTLPAPIKESKELPLSLSERKKTASKPAIKILSELNRTGNLGKVVFSNSNQLPRERNSVRFTPQKDHPDDFLIDECIEVIVH